MLFFGDDEQGPATKKSKSTGKNTFTTIVTVSDPEGNLYQLLKYLAHYNESNQEKGSFTLEINPEGKKDLEDFIKKSSPQNKLPDNNIDLLLEAITLGLNQGNPYAAFSVLKDPSNFLNAIYISPPENHLLHFGGDIADATSAPGHAQPNIMHHQLLLLHIVKNTLIKNNGQAVLTLGNRDINKRRLPKEFSQDYINSIRTSATHLINQLDPSTFTEFEGKLKNFSEDNNDGDKEIKKFWYKNVTEYQIIHEDLWATETLGDFFIYTGMLEAIKSAHDEGRNIKEAILADLAQNQSRTTENYLNYIHEKTMGAPQAVASMQQEVSAYYRDTTFNYLEKIYPLFHELYRHGKLIDVMYLQDGSGVVLVHGYFGKKVVDIAKEINNGMKLEKNIESLEDIVYIFDQLKNSALLSQDSTKNSAEQVFDAVMYLQNLALPTTTSHKGIAGSPITENYALESDPDALFNQLIERGNIQVIIVGHLPQNQGAVYKTPEGLLVLATDNSKQGYCLTALDHKNLIFYIAESYEKLMSGDIKKRQLSFNTLPTIFNEYPLLGTNVTFSAGLPATLENTLEENSTLKNGKWRIVHMDNAVNVTLSQNGGPNQGFQSCTCTVPWGEFIAAADLPEGPAEKNYKHGI